MKRIFEASPEQIKRINIIEGDNARHIQEKYEREISDE
jgi:carbonic anhydrase